MISIFRLAFLLSYLKRAGSLKPVALPRHHVTPRTGALGALSEGRRSFQTFGSRRKMIGAIVASGVMSRSLSSNAIEISSFSEAAAKEKAGMSAGPPTPIKKELSKTSSPSAVLTESTDKAITHRVRFSLHIAETQASVEGRTGLPPEDGEITIGLYGKAAPRAVENFLSYCVPPEVVLDSGDVEKKPSLAKALLWRMEPGVSVEVGGIKGLQVVPFAGSTALKYNNWLTPVSPVAEGNGLLHDRRGLLTRRPLNVGPAFEITLAEAPQLDRTGAEVFGVVLKDEDNFLEKVEGIPLYSSRAAEESGAFADAVFQAQKKVYSDMAKGLGDSRFEDQTGKLLRKVEIRAVSVL